MKYKIIMRGYSVIFMSLLISFCIFVQVHATSTDQSQLQIIESYEKIDLVEVRLDAMNEINNKILNTVYWTLGILATIFLGTIAVNLYQNFSINKRKLEAIEKRLTDDAKNKFDNLKIQIQKDIVEQEKRISSMIDKGVKSEVAVTNKQIEDLTSKMYYIETDFLSLVIDMAIKAKKGHLFQLKKLLELNISRGWKYDIDDTLDKINAQIQKEKLYPDDIREVQELLDKLPKEYNVVKQEIINKMSL